MITNIQALRSLAAFAVLVYHTAFPLLPGNHTDFQGVAIFFVISGFIMTYITLKDNRESAPLSFFLHRTVRIVPLYWLCTFYVVAFNVYAGLKKICAAAGFPGSDWILPWNSSGIFSSITDLVGTDVFQGQLADVVKSLLFVPYLNNSGIPHPLLAVGWTLNMEMHFYLCFALMLNFKKELAPALTFFLVAGLIAFARSSGGDSPSLTLHASGYPLYFCAGILVYYIWTATNLADMTRWSWVAIPASIAGIFLYLAANLFPGSFRPILGAVPVLLVLSALVLHSCQWRITNRFLLLLGASSYALYLTHTLVLELQRVLSRSFSVFNFEVNLIGFAFSLAASLGIAIAVHLFLELPITAWLRQKLASVLTPQNSR